MINIYKKGNFMAIVGWAVVFIALFIYLQLKGLFNFYFMEQWQIFLYDWPFVTSVLWQPGGMVQLISDFLVQFFAYPYCGALILALLLTTIGFFSNKIFKQIAPACNISAIGLLPIISLLLLQFNSNYHLAGTIAFLLFVIVLNFYLTIDKLLVKVLYASCASLLLYLLAGPIASIFAVSVLLIELILNIRKSYFFLIPSAIVFILATISLHLGVTGELKYLLLPDGYFTLRLQAGNIIYQPWILMLALILGSLLLHWIKDIKKRIGVISLMCQIIVIGWFANYSLSFIVNSQHEFFKELDYYMRTENWDRILQRCKVMDMNNYLYQNCRNVALAEKGELAEHLFDYQQQGLQSIYLTWDKTPYISALLSDVYYSMGHIAMSQKMAFESSGSGSENNYNPRMLKRLVQTNLIFGAYKVAEKYITLLEKTQFYREWAHSQRQFLYNDRAIEANSLLAAKRRCLFPEKTISGNDGINVDLKHIIDHNPSHRASIQYLGAIYLLIKDIDNFKSLMENYYGTPVLPYLPKPYQECMMLFTTTDSEIMEHYDISNEVVQSYKAFRTLKTDQVVQEYQTIMNRETDKRATYWHYLLCYKENN